MSTGFSSPSDSLGLSPAGSSGASPSPSPSRSRRSRRGRKEEEEEQLLHRKRLELSERIAHKLAVLRSEQLSLKEEVSLNEELGRRIAEVVHGRARHNERVKFDLHVEEIEKITALLLGLSARLARTESRLQADRKDVDGEERKMLEGRRAKLSEQLDEAKRLKESLDRRSAVVSTFLRGYLDAEQFADYDHFVKMKAKLIMDSREVQDKIALGEEQVRALRETMRRGERRRGGDSVGAG